MVQMTGSPFNYICIQPVTANSGEAPTVNASNAYWAVEPWTDHITKTPVNSATFDQLWLAYWNAMTDNGGNVPAGTDTAMFRNPIRASQSASTATGAGGGGATGGSSGNGPPATGTGPTITPSTTGGDDTATIQAAINGSNPGDIITFTKGVFHVSQTLTFLSNRTYLGAGAEGVDITTPPSLTPAETLKMRAAIAAANTATLRGGGNNVVSQLVYLGQPNGGSTLVGGQPHRQHHQASMDRRQQPVAHDHGQYLHKHHRGGHHLRLGRRQDQRQRDQCPTPRQFHSEHQHQQPGRPLRHGALYPRQP